MWNAVEGEPCSAGCGGLHLRHAMEKDNFHHVEQRDPVLHTQRAAFEHGAVKGDDVLPYVRHKRKELANRNVLLGERLKSIVNKDAANA